MRGILIGVVLAVLGFFGYRYLALPGEPAFAPAGPSATPPSSQAGPAASKPPAPDKPELPEPPRQDPQKAAAALAEAKRRLPADEAAAKDLLLSALQEDPRGAAGKEAAGLLAPIAAKQGDKRLQFTAEWRCGTMDGTQWLKLQALNEPLLSPKQASANPATSVHLIAYGETLEKLARRYGSTIEMLRLLNHLPSDMIRVGDRLKVLPLKGRVEVEVRKSEFACYLLYDGQILKRYPVGIGQEDLTPEGTFQIATRLVNPPWWKPGSPAAIPHGDPGNILGTRWLGFAEPHAKFAVHGTTQPETVGKKASNGCIRMKNADVEELYCFCPLGTVVTIVP